MKVDSRRDTLLRSLRAFEDCTIAFATGGAPGYEEWERAREDLLSQPELLPLLPRWISANRSGSQFWHFMKAQNGTYAGRREFIWTELAPLHKFVEEGATQPTSLSLEPFIARGTAASIGEAWSRIQARREADPEGAITLARSLLEGTCKDLLHKLKVQYSEKDDLPKLYGLIANAMNLGPRSHKEEVFKQILGGCMSVVNGLAALRNTFGDAHGKAPNTPKPAARHADLAINLAGTLAERFLWRLTRIATRGNRGPNKRMDQSGRGRRLSQAGTTRRRTVKFPDRAAAPQVMRGR